MIVPVKITVRNFLSIEDLEFTFEEGKTLPIFGINKTDEGKESNGSGKSSFQQAIEFALKRSTSRYDRDSLLIQRGKDEAFIGFLLYNKKSGERIYLEHTIRKKAPYFNIFVNDVQVELSSIDEARKWVYDYIGISSEDLSSFYLPNERNYIPFFTGSNTKKVALITRLSNSGIIDMAIDRVNEDIVRHEELSKKSSDRIIALKAQVEIYSSEINKTNPEEFEKQKQKAIEELEFKILNKKDAIEGTKIRIAEVNQRIAGGAEKIREIEKNILELNESLNKIPGTDALSVEVQSLSNTKKEYLLLKEEIQSQYRTVESIIRNLFKKKLEYENILSGEITCPKCNHKFLLREDVLLEDVRTQLSAINANLDDRNKSLDALSKVIEEMEGDINSIDTNIFKKSQEISQVNALRLDINKKISTLKGLIQEILNENQSNSLKIKSYENQIEDFQKDISYLRERIVEKQFEKFNNLKIKELEALIKEKQDEIEKETLEFQALGERLMNIRAWLNNFKKFKSFLANKQLKVIQGLVNKQLQDMGVDMQIKIEGFKVLANGEIREQITGYVIENGNVAEYKEFSKGERSRIDYAMILAMQNLCNSGSRNGGLDLLFADEISEGIDPLGNTLLLSAIQKTGRTSLIVSHVGTITPENECIMAVKINGVTEIKKGFKYELEKKYQQI